MSITLGTIVTALLVAEVVCAAVEFLHDLWGYCVNAPGTLCTAEMSETDIKMQEQTRDMIHETFGENIIDSVQDMDAAQRIKSAQNLIQALQKEYDLDVKVEFYGDDRHQCGFYNSRDNTLNLNVADLLSKTPERIQEFFDTIIHELRHAVQWKAIREAGYWNVEEERSKAWAKNFANYISASVDPRGYANQLVEVDARTFASGCLEGVF